MRLVDADALMRDIEHYNLSDGKFQHWVEVQPTIEERKVGKWIEKDEFTVECSICKSEWLYETHFCPHCGARMEVGT